MTQVGFYQTLLKSKSNKAHYLMPYSQYSVTFYVARKRLHSIPQKHY